MTTYAPLKMRLPTGIVTLLFTDIYGSSRLWEQHGDAFIPVWQTHDAIMRNSIDRFGGYEVKSEGDAFMVAFSDSKAALYCSIFAQAALTSYPWPRDVGGPLVRMGLHTGEPFVQNNDYFGPTVNRAAYISAAAHGGQILVSEETCQALAGRADSKIEFTDLGEMRLKDQGMPHRLYQVFHPNMKHRDFPPPLTLETPLNNLPVQRTSFVGRAKELEHIASFLAMGEKPVLSITGPGGVGKTRLSLQAAAYKAEWFPEGVWYVKLKGAKDIESAAVEIASALGISLPANCSPLTEVRDWLADRRCLLILDDANAVPQVSRLIRELLSGAEHLRCIATSSESLEIEEARELPLAGLSTTEHTPSIRALKTHPVAPALAPPLPPAFASSFDIPLENSDAGRLYLERFSERMNRRLGEPQRLAAETLLKTMEGIPSRIEQAVQTLNPSGSFQPQTSTGEATKTAPASSGGERFRKLLRKGAQKVVQAVEDAAYGDAPHPK